MDISGNKMLHLKQDLAFLRQRLAECSEESAKQSIRREIMEKETYCFDYYIVYSVMPGSIITNLAVDYILFCG